MCKRGVVPTVVAVVRSVGCPVVGSSRSVVDWAAVDRVPPGPCVGGVGAIGAGVGVADGVTLPGRVGAIVGVSLPVSDCGWREGCVRRVCAR